MSTPTLNSIPTNKRGRPRSVRQAVISLIGTAGLYALERNDLFVVSGAILRELSLIVGEPAPEKPQATNEEAADATQTPAA